MENVLKGLAFKSQCFIFLWHVAQIFRHPQRRGVYLEPLHADSFSLNAAEQRHHQFFLPTPWLHYKGAKSQASNASKSRRLSLLKATTFFLCSPAKLTAMIQHSMKFNQHLPSGLKCVTLEFGNLDFGPTS